MSDLTERLAAKLGRGECVTIDGERMVYLVRAKYLLPLLLSEPELVAGLAPEVKRALLLALLREMTNANGHVFAGHDYDGSGREPIFVTPEAMLAYLTHYAAPPVAPLEAPNE